MANVLIPFPGASAKDVETLVAIPAEQVICADPRARARVLGLASRAWRSSRRSSRSACRAPRRWCACTTRSTRTATGCRASSASASRSIKPKGIDDVPIVTLTLWTADDDARRLRARARRARAGGRAQARARHARGDDDRRPGRVVRVLLDPERLAAFKLTAADIRRALLPPTARCPRARSARTTGRSTSRPGNSSPSAQDVRALVVGVGGRQPGLPVATWRASSTVRRTPARYVWLGTGPAAAAKGIGAAGEFPAVTHRRHQEAGRERGRWSRIALLARVGRARQHRDPRRRRGDGDAQLRRDRQRQGA